MSWVLFFLWSHQFYCKYFFSQVLTLNLVFIFIQLAFNLWALNLWTIFFIIFILLSCLQSFSTCLKNWTYISPSSTFLAHFFTFNFFIILLDIKTFFSSQNHCIFNVWNLKNIITKKLSIISHIGIVTANIFLYLFVIFILLYIFL